MHAGYLLENNGTRLLFDPIFENPFSVNAHAYPSVNFDLDKLHDETFTAVFISHHHDDHCSLESLDHLPRSTPLYLYCEHPAMFAWLGQMGFQQVYPLTLDTAVLLGNFSVTPRAAVERDVDCLFEISCAGLNILNVVDAAIEPKIVDSLSKTSWDMVLWPFQIMRERDVLSPARFPLTDFVWPEEWPQQLKKLKPRYVVPSACQFIHEEWSWYRQAFFPVSYKMFTRFVNELLPESEVQRMNPGQAVSLSSQSLHHTEPLAWVHPLGEQNVDYEFNPQATWSSTADIACHFPPLNESQKQRLLHFCRSEIAQRFYDIGPSADLYFQKKRMWCLSIYDHAGTSENFYYIVQDENMQLTESATLPLAWHTQIPAHKLHSALENGETLTSLYIRVNEETFDKKIEEDLDSVDIMEDPLIRVLYTGIFAGYQQAQLRRAKRIL